MFSRFFIDRPIFAGVVSMVIVIAGAITVPFLPIEQYPDITPPTVVISTQYPGANAQVVANTVVTPIEEQVNGVDNMIYMSSSSSADGQAKIVVTFRVGTDPDIATMLVQNRVKIAEPRLPEEVMRQGVTVKKQSTNLTLMLTLFSPDARYDDIFLSNYAIKYIKDVISRVPGVGEVTVFGSKNYGMRIWIDPELLAARRMTAEDVIRAIQEQNVQVAAGKIGQMPAPDNQDYQYTITATGRLTDPEEFKQIVVKDDGRRLVRIKDIAHVELGSETYDSNALLNGAPAAAIGVYQLPGANALEVADGVDRVMRDLAERFPQGLEFATSYDSTLFVRASIREVITTLFIAFVLVFLSVWVFLQDFRATMIPGITIPVSLIGTFAVMMVLGFSINTLTLFGLILVIGIVVDDAIVVVENTTRLMEQKKLPRREAAKQAMDEVTGPVIATTLVLLAVFVPTAFLGGVTGRLYQPFALTISVATVFSSINALTLSPALSAILLRPPTGRRGWFTRAFDRVFGRVQSGNSWLVDRLIRRLGIIMILLVGCFVANYFSFMAVPGGFIPDEDQGYFFLNIQLPDGAALTRTDAVVREVDQILADTPGIDQRIFVTGYSMLDDSTSPNYAFAVVTLAPWEDRDTPELRVDAILYSIYGRFQKIQDAIVLPFVPPAITGLGATGGFAYQLEDRAGTDLIVLQQMADELVQRASKNPELTRVNTTFRATVPQLFVDVNRVKAKRMGVPVTAIFQTLQANLGSIYINDFNKFGRVYKVMIQADQAYRSQIEDIGKLEVRSNTGRMVPLSTLVDIEEIVGPSAIKRYNLYPTAAITGSPVPGVSSGQAIKIMEQLSDRLLPNSMGYEWTGMSYQEIQAQSQAGVIFALSLTFVFLFLAAQYESWSIPIAILFGVPFAVLGGIGAIWLLGIDNNIYVQIGFVLLIGLSCKNAILIVEFAKQLRQQGRPTVDAAGEAARLRFRPILMTAFSFILGVLPLVLATGAGAASRTSLGTVVFGGMIAATFAGTLLTPGLYTLVQTTKEKFSRKKKAALEKVVEEKEGNEKV